MLFEKSNQELRKQIICGLWKDFQDLLKIWFLINEQCFVTKVCFSPLSLEALEENKMEITIIQTS